MERLLAYSNGIDLVGLLTLWGLRLIGVLVIVVVGLWLARRLSTALSSALERTAMEPILRNFVGNIAYAVIVVLVAVTALDAIGVPPTSLLAVVGAAGLAVGLAMRDSLSNIAAGIMLIILRPFHTGDVVRIAGTDGVIEQVRLFQTVVRTFDNHEVVLPNGQITAQPIINFTARAQRRIDIPVGIDYGDDIAKAREVLLALAATEARVLDDPAPAVVVTGLGDSSVDLSLRAWVDTPDFAATRSALLEAIHRELPANGLSIPFPQRDVHLRLPEGLPELPRRAGNDG